MIMKKGLILLFGCFLSIQVMSAQSIKYHYAKIYAQADLTINRTIICIDYGQSRKLNRDNRIRADNGEVRHFNSMMGGLIFLAENGWEFVQVFTVNQNYPQYLIKKSITTELTSDFFPKTKQDFP